MMISVLLGPEAFLIAMWVTALTAALANAFKDIITSLNTIQDSLLQSSP